MPGRLFYSGVSAVSPDHLLMPTEDRPIPAARQNLRRLPDVQNGGSLYSGRSQVGDGGRGLQVKERNTQVANGANMTSCRRLEGRQSHQQASLGTPYQMPSEALNHAPTHRPQSAMAFSSSSSYNHAKAMYPPRPPSSLGVSWGPSPPISGIGGNMRSHSYGDGVTLGEGYSGLPYTCEKSEDVYASVGRRQDRVQRGDINLGYDQTYNNRQQTQISGKFPAGSRVSAGQGSTGRHQGADNLAFVSDNLAFVSDNLAFVSDNLPGPGGEITTRRPSISLDMRTAWQSLYGNSQDPGVSIQHPAVDDAVSPGKTRTMEDVPQTFNCRQQINPSHLDQPHLQHQHLAQPHLQHPHLAQPHLHNPHLAQPHLHNPHIDQPHLQHPHLAQPHLKHPHITKSNPPEPAHNAPGSSLHNGRFTPHLTSPDLNANSSSQNGIYKPRNSASPVLHANSSSQNGIYKPRNSASPDVHDKSSSQNGIYKPRNSASPVLHANRSSPNGIYKPRNSARPDLHAGSLSGGDQSAIIRESPTGQSSSNLDPSSNNSSQLSAFSVSTKTFNTFKPMKSNCGSDPTIGPASKYPDIQMSTRMSTQASHQTAIHKRNRIPSDDKRADRRQSLASPHFISKSNSPRRQNNSTSDTVGVGIQEDSNRPPSRFGSAVLHSDDSFEDEYSLQPHDSILNYHEGGSEDGTVTPRASSQASAPSHTPRGTSRRTDNSTPVPATPGFSHRTSPTAVTAPAVTVPAVTAPVVRSPDFVPKTPDLLRKSPEAGTIRQTSNNTGRSRIQQTEKNRKAHVDTAGKEDWGSADGQHNNKARSRSLDDVRESENDSLLSFDVENTILTVEPSDQSHRGTVRSHKGSNSVRAQLHRLEGMYSHVMKTLDETSHGTRTRRRWSIGSSDTSSMRHHTHHSLHSRTSTHRLAAREVKVIGKRFQRLESHVITLARSVAHLSSELRVQNSLSREMENVKREIQELKSQSSTFPSQPGNIVRPNRLMSDFERNQGWVPSLTNPRRVNKLTRFFGQEPPLLEIFLKQLGYEKYLTNFEQEHIGMIELPYMSEDKLQALGIPMGPRLRILQEAQVYFKQANLDLYFV